MVDPVIGTVHAEFFSRLCQLDRLQEGVGRSPDFRVRGVRPVAEGEETDLLHDCDGRGTWWLQVLQ
jgi:hypothetical protein